MSNNFFWIKGVGTKSSSTSSGEIIAGHKKRRKKYPDKMLGTASGNTAATILLKYSQSFKIDGGMRLVLVKREDRREVVRRVTRGQGEEEGED